MGSQTSLVSVISSVSLVAVTLVIFLVSFYRNDQQHKDGIAALNYLDSVQATTTAALANQLSAASLEERRRSLISLVTRNMDFGESIADMYYKALVLGGRSLQDPTLFEAVSKMLAFTSIAYPDMEGVTLGFGDGHYMNCLTRTQKFAGKPETYNDIDATSHSIARRLTADQRSFNGKDFNWTDQTAPQPTTPLNLVYMDVDDLGRTQFESVGPTTFRRAIAYPVSSVTSASWYKLAARLQGTNRTRGIYEGIVYLYVPPVVRYVRPLYAADDKTFLGAISVKITTQDIQRFFQSFVGNSNATQADTRLLILTSDLTVVATSHGSSYVYVAATANTTTAAFTSLLQLRDISDPMVRSFNSMIQQPVYNGSLVQLAASTHNSSILYSPPANTVNATTSIYVSVSSLPLRMDGVWYLAILVPYESVLGEADRTRAAFQRDISQRRKDTEDEFATATNIDIIIIVLGVLAIAVGNIATAAWNVTHQHHLDKVLNDLTKRTREVRCAPRSSCPLITIMFTDIESSTALWGKHPYEMSQALALHHEIIRSVIAQYDGYEVKTIGDSFMVAFDKPENAVKASMEIQYKLWNVVWPNGTLFDDAYVELHGGKNDHAGLWNGLRVRIGMDCGECEVVFDDVSKGYDYYGPTVNCAARVESVAHGGQVVVSERVWQASSLDSSVAVTTSIGKFELKGVDVVPELYQISHPTLQGRTYPVKELEHESTHDTEKEPTLRSYTPIEENSLVTDVVCMMLSVLPKDRYANCVQWVANGWGVTPKSTSRSELLAALRSTSIKVGMVMQGRQYLMDSLMQMGSSCKFGSLDKSCKFRSLDKVVSLDKDQEKDNPIPTLSVVCHDT